MPLLPILHTTLQRDALLRGGECIVVAVSGGPDSLCLLHLLWRLREELGLQLHVAHLDHGFRGAQSAAEAAFVAEFAQQLGLPATIERRDVPAWARSQRLNAQAAARSVRYTFLAQVAQAQVADAMAVAHQADDQAETVLMHLLRGAGPAGLRGMRRSVPWRDWAADTFTDSHIQPPLIRPLLDVSRAAIEEYCVVHNLDPRHDPSNTARHYTRSRVRADLLPQLSVYNQHITRALAHTATICADDYDYIEQQLEAYWPTLVTEHNETFMTVASQPWQALHPALQRAALRRALAALGGANDVSFEHIEGARGATGKGVGTQFTLPGGLRLVVDYHGFTLTREAEPPVEDLPQLPANELAVVVGNSTLLNGDWRLEIAATQPPDWIDNRWSIVIDADRLDGLLLLRGRRSGDRFRPAGGVGSRRLQDLFVDAKVPRTLRAAWPLLATPHSIVWIAGLRADERFGAHATTTQRLWVRCRKNS